MGQTPAFEKLHVYQLADRLANGVWEYVVQWSIFAQRTVGDQFVRATDSIGANLAEGYGRGTPADKRRFAQIARGSLNESICWLRRAITRHLLTPEQASTLEPIVDELGPRLNAYLTYLEQQIKPKSAPDETGDSTSEN